MKITKEGKRFLVATLFIGIAAFNTGNNLIYLILSLMLSFILLSIVILKINLSGLELEVFIKPPLYAGQSHYAIYKIVNKKRVIPTYSVNVLSSGIASKVYCAVIPAGQEIKQKTHVSFNKRGLFSYGDFFLQSSFPFIFFTKTERIRILSRILVYPALINVDDIVSELTGGEELSNVKAIGRGEELQYLRHFRLGDDQRKIHWKASAKSSRLQIKEFAEHEMQKITVHIDNLMPKEGDLFERTVSLSGSICRHFLELGYMVRVFTCRKVIPFGGGQEQLFRILDFLASIKEENICDCPFPAVTDSTSVAILKSPSSSFKQYLSPDDMVIYAGTL